MNLFGNSLVSCAIWRGQRFIDANLKLQKYTDKGSIVVSIRLHELETERGPSPEEKMLELIIQDTGKGISSSYLQNNLFTRKNYTRNPVPMCYLTA